MPDVPEHLEPLSDLIEYLDHVAIGVRDVAAAAELLELLGGAFVTGADNRRGGFRWIHYRLPGGAKVEALAPISDDCFLWRFLNSRGEGMHHVTFKVSSVTEAARRAERAGLRVVGLYLDPGAWSECFIHPAAAHGTLIQLAEWPEGLFPEVPLEDVLAGKVIED